ncbi:MAG: polysaccharide biosynthesis tyrosine autokinase [Lentisphaeria bacterium]|nr:polysaccharide biosynthesis tyrosine autokinase [Lentisphaeria bacterium]
MKQPATKQKEEAAIVAPEALPVSASAPPVSGDEFVGHKAPPEEVNKFDPRRIIGLILAYWWLITLFALIGAAGGAAYCVLGTPKYQAACQYQIFVEQALNVGVQTTLERNSRQFSRQVTLLESDILKNRVKTKLTPEYENQLAGNLDVEVNVIKDRRRPVLYIFVEASDEAYATAFLRELIRNYEEMRKLEDMDATDQSLRILRLEKERLTTELQDARERLRDFQTRHNLKVTRARSAQEEKRFEDLISRLNALRMESSMIETQLEALENANTATINNVLQLTMETHGVGTGPMGTGAAPAETADVTDGGDGSTDSAGETGITDGIRLPTAVLGTNFQGRNWELFEERLARLEAKYQDKLRYYQPGHPAMDRIKQDIAQVRKDIEFESELARRRLQARYDALKIQQEALEISINTWKNQYDTLSIADANELKQLTSEIQRLEVHVSQFTTKIIDVASKSADAIVTQLIAEPKGRGQIWPKPLVVMGASTGVSAAVGIALAFMLFFMDTRFTDAVAIEHRLRLPFISGIPRWERVIKDLDPDVSIVMDKEHANAVSESYRCLRVNLERNIKEKKGYTLLLTSADAGEGKSITSANLGIAFSWTGRRVLLIDADLRRPNLHNALGLKSSQTGLAQFLVGDVKDWRQVVQKTDFDNVDMMQAGKFVYEAPELCSTSRLKSLFAEMGEEYDFIILDTAPVGRIVDTAMMARAVDGIMFVSLHGKTSVSAMRHALKRLEGTNVLGFCLNAIDMPRGHGYYYGGYYNYRWQYGLYSYYYYYSNSLYGYDYGKEGYDYTGYRRGADVKEDIVDADEKAVSDSSDATVS